MGMHTASTVPADPDNEMELGFDNRRIGWAKGWAEPCMITRLVSTKGVRSRGSSFHAAAAVEPRDDS